MSSKKRIPLRKFFPNGFDKTNPDDMMKLTVLIQERAAQDPAYKGYSVYRVDPDDQYAIIAPMDEDNMAEINEGAKAVKLDIARCTDYAAQKTTVRQMETEYPGYSVVDFVRLSNSEGMVILQQLDDKTISTRRIFANVLGLNRQPWNIRVTRTPENGWKIRIKEGTVTYQASKFDKKMQEAVETVGKPGWFFRADPKTGVIMVYPGVLPTFPPSIPMPKDLWHKTDLHHSYFGMKLPDRGRETGDWAYIDWEKSPSILVCGATSGGKSVYINSLIYGVLKAGGQIAICDHKPKSVDFKWCRPWVMDKGWGCDGPEYCAATLQHILDICDYRAKIISDYGKENWWQLPDAVREKNPFILLVCDEIAQWAAPVTVPKMDKGNPDRIKLEYKATINASNYIRLLSISQTVRFTGIGFLFASQSATRQNGLDPSMRTNCTGKLLVGESVSDDIRKQVLQSPKEAPRVPENVKEQGVGKGTAVAEISGQTSYVCKSFFEATETQSWSDILREHLSADYPAPGNMESGHWTWEEVVNTIPTAASKPDDGSMYEDDEPEGRLESEGGFGVDGRDVADHDAPLKGAAKAAHVSAIEAARLSARLAAEKGM